MKLPPFAAAAALAAMTAVPAAAATFTNAGFETGDLTGWTFSDGFVEASPGTDDASGNTPPFGQHFSGTNSSDFFAKLTAGIDVGVYTLLSQDFTLTTSGFVSGDAAFLAFDETPYNDDGFVRIMQGDNIIQTLFARDVVAVDNYGHTDWTPFVSQVLSIGTYTLVAGVRNNPEDDENFGPSELLVDSLAITDAPGGPTGGVPEPASWALMITGFAGLGATLRRRRSAVLQGA